MTCLVVGGKLVDCYNFMRVVRMKNGGVKTYKKSIGNVGKLELLLSPSVSPSMRYASREELLFLKFMSMVV